MIFPLSLGHAAAKRCRPYMNKAQASFLDACKKIGSEYAKLADDQKRVFREELNISLGMAQSYAAVARYADDKLVIIEGGLAPSSPPPSANPAKPPYMA